MGRQRHLMVSHTSIFTKAQVLWSRIGHGRVVICVERLGQERDIYVYLQRQSHVQICPQRVSPILLYSLSQIYK